MVRGIIAGWIKVVVLVGSTTLLFSCSSAELPDPSLSPQEVVMVQLEALQQNDLPSLDHGIEIAWNFASPNNKETTGPIERFGFMVHNERYRALLNCRTFEVRTHFQEKSEAEFIVMVEDENGEVFGYMIELSLQKYPPYENCWMIDAVIPMKLPTESQPKMAGMWHSMEDSITFSVN